MRLWTSIAISLFLSNLWMKNFKSVFSETAVAIAKKERITCKINHSINDRCMVTSYSLST